MHMTASSMLPPVTEALSLLDVSFVNSDWQGTPATMRRSIQILVDHLSVQSVQLSRVEDILASFGNPTQQGGTVWSKLATKADLSRLEKLEQQVDEVLIHLDRQRSTQTAAAHQQEDTACRLELLRDQVATVEARLGLPSTSASDSSSAGLDQQYRRVGGYGSPSKGLGPVASSLPTGSILDRIQRLERRADTLTETGAKAEDDASELVSRLREMEPRLEVQLGHLRADIKQALALAAASTRLEADAEATSRVKEAEKRLISRIQSVESHLESRIATVSSAAGASLGGELDKRVQSLYDHVDLQVNRLASEVDRLSRDKIDLPALEHYSQRISGLFETVAGQLADEVGALTERLRSEVAAAQEQAEESQAREQALQENVRREMEGMRVLSGQVKDALEAVQETLETTPRVLEETRAAVRHIATDAEQLQTAVAGLNSAMSSTGSALELQNHKMGQLGQRLTVALVDIAAVKDALWGTGAGGGPDSAGGTERAGGASGIANSSTVVAKLNTLERCVTDLAAQVGSKADDAAARELDRRVAALGRQQDVTAEGVRTLTTTAFKRLDEHASGLQRLTLAVSSNLEERPTATSVKHLVEAASLEVRERCEGALAPLWDAVRILQSGLRDVTGEVKVSTGSIATLQQVQTEGRTKLASEKTSLLAALRKALDEELGNTAARLDNRINDLEGEVAQAAKQLEVQAQLQDRLGNLVTAVEDQLTTQVSAWRSTGQALRADLGQRIDAAVAGLNQRCEAVEVATRQHTADVQVLEETCNGKADAAAARSTAEAAARQVVKQEVARYADKEEIKWQVWLEQYSQGQEHLATKGEVAVAIEGSVKQLYKDIEAAFAPKVEELRRASASLRGELEGRLRAAGSRLDVAEVRLGDIEAELVQRATRRDLEDLQGDVSAGQVDRANLAARLRQATMELEGLGSALAMLHAEAVTRGELASELSRKVDLSAYLAAGTARAAAATAAGALISASGAGRDTSGSPPPQHPASARPVPRPAPVPAAGGGATSAAAAVAALQGTLARLGVAPRLP